MCLYFKKQEKNRDPDFTTILFAEIVFSFITLMSTNTCDLTIYSYLHSIKKKHVTEWDWQQRNP
jgi:hypothetical protein